MIMTCTVETSVENSRNLWGTFPSSTGLFVQVGQPAQPGDDGGTMKHALSWANSGLPTIHRPYNNYHLFNSFLYMNRTGTTP